MKVKAKKHLGQHFLKDTSICQRIVESISLEKSQNILEIGPGTGALTKWLIEEKKISTLIYIAEDQSPGVPRKGYLETVIEGAKSFNAHQEWLAELKSWAN